MGKGHLLAATNKMSSKRLHPAVVPLMSQNRSFALVNNRESMGTVLIEDHVMDALHLGCRDEVDLFFHKKLLLEDKAGHALSSVMSAVHHFEMWQVFGTDTGIVAQSALCHFPVSCIFWGSKSALFSK